MKGTNSLARVEKNAALSHFHKPYQNQKNAVCWSTFPFPMNKEANVAQLRQGMISAESLELTRAEMPEDSKYLADISSS